MAYDIVLGITKKSWARGALPSRRALPPAEPTIEYTDKEKAGLEKLASIKMRAESGDRRARARWIAISRKIESTKARAAAGDPKARRSLAIMRQAGFLQDAQRLSFSSGEQASFDDAWAQVRAYGDAIERKDAKAARDSIEWMILRGWKASNVSGTFPSYPKITWSHASLPGKKIAFATSGTAYVVSIVSGEIGPRKEWADSEKVPQGARKPWTDSESPPGPRKSWIDDDIPILTRRARAGDVSAQIALRKIALHKAADDEEMSLGNTCMGDEDFIGDEIPHDTYRAAVMLTAIKNAGGQEPTTKHIFAAKSKVDKALGNMGISIYLPGARPSRKTI